jgi:beta-galactosidase
MGAYVSAGARTSRMRRLTVGLTAAAVIAAATAVVSQNSAAHAAPPPGGDAVVSAHPADGVLNQGNRTLDFDHGWKFKLVNTADTTDPSGVYGDSSNPLASVVGFDDSAWAPVTLPHDWSIGQLPDPANSNATGYFPGGLGWYRKAFTLPATMAGKRLSVEFDGVYMNSYVYLNGTLLGNHPYGYTGFNFDITSLVHADGVTPNVLAVVVQNKEPSSRWYSGSGITRNVHLTVTDPIHVSRDGTFVTTPDLATTITTHYADVHVQTQAQDDNGTSADAQIVSTIKNSTGQVVATNISSKLTVSATPSMAQADITVKNPHLWSTTDPYLYTLQTDVVVGHRTVDTYDTTFGIRWLVFDPNGGVMVNGSHIKIQGVDLHNDQGALGSVNNYDALWRQMSILKSQGVNAFRTSHNPPSPEMIDVCQRLGILMMVEAYDVWGSGKTSFDYHLYFNQWGDSDIAEMVNEAKNSPAVMMWSIGNEIPGWTSASSLPVEQRLISDIKSIDTTRPVVAGSDQYRRLPTTGSVAEQMLQNLDGLGLNYNPAQVVDGLHAKYPTKFFFESESSSEESARGVYQDPDYLNTGENYTPGKLLTSSYDNNLASWTMSDEYGLKKDRDRQSFAGQFIWSGFDYIGEPTPYSQFPVKVSSFGTVDTAGFPKDAYYAFQSQWTSKPMVHLLPMNWTDYKPGQNVEVWAYSTAKSVELFLNGASLGVQSFDTKTSTEGVSYLETTQCTNDDKNYTTGTCPGSYQSPNGSSGKLHLTWNVPFAPGQLVAVAKDTNGHQIARDEVDTAGAPYTVTLTPNKTVLQDDGKSLSYVTVNVVDAHGVMVPDADNPITFSTTGAGTFQGADNGRQDDAEGYTSTTHTAFNGKALAIVESKDGTTGPITITAMSPGLVPAATTVYSVNQHARGLVALQPVYVRAQQGDSVQLPSAVNAIYADGSAKTLPVRWQTRGLARSGTPPVGLGEGITTVIGEVPGIGAQARAVVTVYRAGSVATYATAVPVGTPPGLPATVTVLNTDGTTRQAAVTWAAVDPSQYALAGQFDVAGVVAGTHVQALATVRVTSAFTPNQDIALATGPTMPSADAGYSGTAGSRNPPEVPAGMLDGVTTSGGWSNFYNKSATNTLPAVSLAHASEWVSVSWPNTQRLTTVVPYFTISANRVLPSTIVASYWDGKSWAPVSNQQVQLATVSAQPTTITFDPVSTTSIRLDLISPAPNTATGFMQITELQVPADELTYSSTAALSDLLVNGHSVPGFDSTVTSYQVETSPDPVVTATPADNASVAVALPLTVPGTAVITVTSEDKQHASTYTITMTPPHHH